MKKRVKGTKEIRRNKEIRKSKEEYVDIEKLITPEDTGAKRIKFPGFKTLECSNQMCQVCFQILNYPDDEVSDS